MAGRLLPSLLLALLLALLLRTACFAQAALSERLIAPPAAACNGSTPETAWAVTKAAQQVCSTLSIAEALRSVVGLKDSNAAARLLSSELGIETALDIQLLQPDGPDAEELFYALKSGGLSLGDRAKIRLLIPARPQHQAFAAVRSTDGSRASSGRFLQESQGDESRGGISVDTIAIVLSVLVVRAIFAHCFVLTIRLTYSHLLSVR
eukprot:SAG31_NODE_597_length_13674_cov_3.402947_13_plen_207_part_00